MNEETRKTIVEASRPVRWAAAAALAMLALFLLVQTFDAMARFGEGENPMVNSITVSGTGTSSAEPDLAMVSFTVQESAADVKAAQDAATKRTNDAIASMKEAGVEESDIKTTNYNVEPQYAMQTCAPGAYCVRPTTNTITGYTVSQSVEVSIHDTSKAADVVTRLGTLGVQNITGPNFTIDDDNGVMNEARADAIRNAHEKAEQLAKELGVSLGDVMSYYDQQSSPMPYEGFYGKSGTAMDVAMTQSVPNLPVGTDERSVTVQVTYEIH